MYDFREPDYTLIDARDIDQHIEALDGNWERLNAELEFMDNGQGTGIFRITTAGGYMYYSNA